LEGGLLVSFEPFLDDFPFFGHFWVLIFPFLSFLRLGTTVYSRAGCDPVQLLIRKRL
jgi:hypothetical protein